LVHFRNLTKPFFLVSLIDGLSQRFQFLVLVRLHRFQVDMAHGFGDGKGMAALLNRVRSIGVSSDFFIELLSASDNLTATKVKMQRWIENCAKLAWLVDPFGRKVYVDPPGVGPLTVSDSTVRGTGPVEGFCA
jgi:hypothetical protein